MSQEHRDAAGRRQLEVGTARARNEGGQARGRGLPAHAAPWQAFSAAHRGRYKRALAVCVKVRRRACCGSAQRKGRTDALQGIRLSARGDARSRRLARSAALRGTLLTGRRAVGKGSGKKPRVAQRRRSAPAPHGRGVPLLVRGILGSGGLGLKTRFLSGIPPAPINCAATREPVRAVARETRGRLRQRAGSDGPRRWRGSARAGEPPGTPRSPQRRNAVCGRCRVVVCAWQLAPSLTGPIGRPGMESTRECPGGVRAQTATRRPGLRAVDGRRHIRRPCSFGTRAGRSRSGADIRSDSGPGSSTCRGARGTRQGRSAA